MATDDLDDTRVLNALGRLLAAGEPFTALPLVDPATKLFPSATMDVLDGRYPSAAEVSDLEASVTTQAETLTSHGADIDGLTTDVGALETLTTSGRLSTSQLSNTIAGSVDTKVATAVPPAVATAITGSGLVAKDHARLTTALGQRLKRAYARRGKSSVTRSVMASPPTTTSDTTARQLSANATVEYRWLPQDTALPLRPLLRVMGGTPSFGNNTSLLAPVVTLPTGTGNTQTTAGFQRDARGWAIEFQYYGRYIEFQMNRRTSQKINVQISTLSGSVNRETITAAPIDNPGGSGDWYYGLDFGGNGQRIIRIEFETSGGLSRIYGQTGQTIQFLALEEPLCVASLGDSVASGTGSTRPCGSWQWALARRLGWTDVRQVAFGGSSFLNPGNNGGTFGSPERLADVVEANPDIIDIMLSINDYGYYADTVSPGNHGPAVYKAAVKSTLAAYRAQFPDKPIFLSSLWPGAATATSAGRDAMEAAAFQAFDEWNDPNSWKFVDTRYGVTGAGWVGSTTGTGNSDTLNSDASHPSDAGHDYLAERRAQLIASTFGLTI